MITIERGLWLGVMMVLGFPDGSNGKASTCCSEDLGLIPESGKYPGEENSNPFQYSCLGNSTDRGAWQTTVHGVAELDTIEQLTQMTLGIVVIIH